LRPIAVAARHEIAGAFHRRCTLSAYSSEAGRLVSREQSVFLHLGQIGIEEGAGIKAKTVEQLLHKYANPPAICPHSGHFTGNVSSVSKEAPHI